MEKGLLSKMKQITGKLFDSYWKPKTYIVDFMLRQILGDLQSK